MDKFSERLVALRKEKDLTQAEFARLCGKQRTTVSGYETEGKEPDFALLCQMADYFGVTTDYLLGRTDAPAPVSDYKKPLPGGGTLDRLYADLLSLGPDGCRAVREYVELQKRARRL